MIQWLFMICILLLLCRTLKDYRVFKQYRSWKEKTKCWVFSHGVTVLRYGFFLVGYWQLDVLVGMLGLYEQRDKWFYFLRGRLTYWDAYVLFSATMAIGFFIPDIIVFLKWVKRRVEWWDG